MNVVQKPPNAIEDPGSLSFVERAIYITLGLGLAATAVRPRPSPILSVLALAAGSYLAWRGAAGSDPVKRVYHEVRDDA